jgi:hypothetical protein
MATKKPPASASKPKPKAAPSRLENLAARQPSFDDTLDEQLVDHSGVFRVTTEIAKAQTGHGDDSSPRFPNDSLAMAAQRDGFRDPEPTIDESIEIEDEATLAVKRQRLATLAARAQRPPTPPARSTPTPTRKR